jgi:hypothetical protein
VVNAWLRVAAVANPELTGVWRGYNVCHCAKYDATTGFTGNSIIFAGCNSDGNEYMVQKGITVRRPIPSLADFCNFVTPHDTYYFAGADTNVWGNMPCIVGSGLTPSANWNITWGALYEVKSTPDISPIAMERPGFEEELAKLIDVSNNVGWTTEANTFESFLKRVWAKLKDAGTWAWKNRKEIAGLGSAIGKMSK